MRLASDEVHTWYVTLDVPPEMSSSLYATLSGLERDRSARLRFEHDRRRFVVAHGALRDVLGRYLGADPAEIGFAYNTFGKPELSPEFDRQLKFNLSHSAGRALIAVTAGADVGVDLEHIRPLADHAGIARRFFSAAEVDQLNRLPGHLQPEAFFCCWTRKEARLKASGEGLAGLDGKSIDTEPARCWTQYTIQPAPGYIGAVVVEGTTWRLHQRDWQTSTAIMRPKSGHLSH